MNVAFRPVICMISDAVMQLGLPVAGFRMADISTLRYFTFKKLLHLWYPDENRFISIDSVDVDVSSFYSVMMCEPFSSCFFPLYLFHIFSVSLKFNRSCY